MLDNTDELDLAIVLSRPKGAEDLVLGRVPASGRDGDVCGLGRRCRPRMVTDVAKIAHREQLRGLLWATPFAVWPPCCVVTEAQ